MYITILLYWLVGVIVIPCILKKTFENEYEVTGIDVLFAALVGWMFWPLLLISHAAWKINKHLIKFWRL